MTAKVTIASLTYNHEAFIEQTLRGFVMQQANFAFEVLIADDCSTDGTRAIIRAYQEAYPEIIKPIFRESNIGMGKNCVDTLSRIKTPYMVCCEGDDYFIDPLKLQKQVDFLDAHPDCAICFHPVIEKWEDRSRGDTVIPLPEHRFHKTDLELDDLLAYPFLPTCACMYRWRFVDEDFRAVFPENIMPCDYFMHLLHAETGGIHYMDEIMAVYRKHGNGAWYVTPETQKNFWFKTGLGQIYFQQTLHGHFAGKREMDVLPAMTRCWYNLLLASLHKRDFTAVETFAAEQPALYEQLVNTLFATGYRA